MFFRHLFCLYTRCLFCQGLYTLCHYAQIHPIRHFLDLLLIFCFSVLFSTAILFLFQTSVLILQKPLVFFVDWNCTKMKFSIKDLFSICDQIHRKLRIWPHLLTKSLMENFIFCAVWTGGIFQHFWYPGGMPVLLKMRFVLVL